MTSDAPFHRHNQMIMAPISNPYSTLHTIITAPRRARARFHCASESDGTSVGGKRFDQRTPRGRQRVPALPIARHVRVGVVGLFTDPIPAYSHTTQSVKDGYGNETGSAACRLCFWWADGSGVVRCMYTHVSGIQLTSRFHMCFGSCTAIYSPTHTKANSTI